MFSAFDNQATFIHTTREPIINEEPTFAFEEEHSHATGHECYTKDPLFFKRFSHIVLVDDEITTGNTALNLIEALHEKSGAKAYSVVALLDWRDEKQQEKADTLAKKLGVTIEFISVVQGTISPIILKAISDEALETNEVLTYFGEVGKNELYGKQVASKWNEGQSKIRILDEYQGQHGNYQTIQVCLDQLVSKCTQGGDGEIRDRKSVV